jgi:CRP-like cAMP-binding protein
MTATTHTLFANAFGAASTASDDTSCHIRLLLARHESLLALSAEQLDALAFAFVEKSYKGGANLVRPGDREPSVFLVLQGEVATRDESGQEHCSRAGQLLTSLACLQGGRATESRRALGPVRVAKLSGAAMSMLLGSNSGIGKALERACRAELETSELIHMAA